MLVLRPEQIQAFEKDMLERFVKRMIPELRKCCAEDTSTIDNETLAETIRSGISIAKQFQITDESDVERYLEFHIRYGSDFGAGETLWAARYLNDDNLTGHQKMNEIWNHDFFDMVLRHSYGM